jgi:SAM-dependent methyltransferase
VFGAFWNFVGFPFRTAALPERWAERAGFTSLQQERINAVWPHIRGRLLDIGAGNNRLVQLYGDGIGLDVYDWGGNATIVKRADQLPFKNSSFDTVTFLACLNHIPEREQTLREAWRVLKPGGKCLVTMINPWIGYINHRLCWYEEGHERTKGAGEMEGFWAGDVVRFLNHAGFVLRQRRRFLYGLNNIFIAEKPR